MVSVGRGDQDAFAILVGRHVDSLYNYALRLGRVPALAEDLVQDAWLAAWQHAASFNPAKAKVTTWLHRILHNKFIDATRRQREHLSESAVAAAVVDSDTESAAANRQSTALLNELIEQLPQNQKAAIVLTHMQGFNNREVAQILGLGVRATESLLARARANLKSGYSVHYSGGTGFDRRTANRRKGHTAPPHNPGKNEA